MCDDTFCKKCTEEMQSFDEGAMVHFDDENHGHVWWNNPGNYQWKVTAQMDREIKCLICGFIGEARGIENKLVDIVCNDRCKFRE